MEDIAEFDSEKLENKILDSKEEIRLNGFRELFEWKDEEFSKQKFMKQLHIYLKDKSDKVLELIIQSLKSLLLAKE